MRELLEMSVAGFACAEGVRLPDERSEEPCEARSQEAERRTPSSPSQICPFCPSPVLFSAEGARRV